MHPGNQEDKWFSYATALTLHGAGYVPKENKMRNLQ